MKLAAMIFDMDGTLGDTMPVVVQALQETFHLYAQHDYTPGEIHTMFGPSEEGVISPRVPVTHFEAAVQHYLKRYAELHRLANQPFPGVLALLKALRARGVRIGVVTGKGAGTAAISMQALGLQPYIEELVCGSPNGAEKPEAIRRLLHDWNIAPEQAVYVGDMPYDMRAAREAGVLALGAAWAAGATVRESDARVFYSVQDLAEWAKEQD